MHPLSPVAATHHPNQLHAPVRGLHIIFCIIFSIYFFRQPFPHPYVHLLFTAAGMALILFLKQRIGTSTLTWVFWFVFLSAGLLRSYSTLANHHFVAWYVSLMLLLFSFGKNISILQYHARFLLMAVLVLSALHKATSASYMDGSFFLFQMDMNIFLKPVNALWPQWQEATQHNLQQYKEWLQTIPRENDYILLQNPVKNAGMVAKISAWIAVAMELIAGVAIFFYPGRRFAHLLLLATIAGVFLFRLETGFLSMLTALGVFLCPFGRIKIAYQVLLLALLALMATGLGLH